MLSSLTMSFKRALARGLRIDVEPSKTPYYLDDVLYVRVGNQAEAIEGKRLEDWLRDRNV